MIIKAGVTYFCKFALAIYYMNHQKVHLIVLMKKSFLSNILLYKYHLKLSSYKTVILKTNSEKGVLVVLFFFTDLKE